MFGQTSGLRFDLIQLLKAINARQVESDKYCFVFIAAAHWLDINATLIHQKTHSEGEFC